MSNRPAHGLLIALLAIGIGLPIIGVAAGRRADDGPTLRSELTFVVALLDDTLAATASGRKLYPSVDSADLAEADAPRNAPDRSPGYHRCTNLRYRFSDVFQAGLAYAFRVRNVADGKAILKAVEQFWLGRGYDFRTTHHAGATILSLEFGYSHLSFYLDELANQIRASGATNCVPLR